MACFTDLDYRNKSYPLLQTIQAAAVNYGNIFSIVSYGCYDAMSDTSKMYQFYQAFVLFIGQEPITENCFVQKTEDQQLFLLNEAFSNSLNFA
jgi:hypothetical protein